MIEFFVTLMHSKSFKNTDLGSSIISLYQKHNGNSHVLFFLNRYLSLDEMF